MIYTGYFANLKKYQERGLTPVSIARITPGWYSGYVLPELAPSKDLLFRYKNGKTTKEDYRAEYLHQLDCVRWSTIVLEKLKTYGPDVILLCYEKSGDFCHRHILAEYLNDSGYKCEEYSLSTKYVKQS